MSKKYLIGLDGGTQSTKVAIFDLKGNVICKARQKLKPLFRPELGVAEHPDDDLWDSITIVCKKVMKKFPGNPKNIVGLGLCSIRTCQVHLKEDGTLAHQIINWMDSRIYERFEFLNDKTMYVTSTNGYVTHRFTGNFNDSPSLYVKFWPIDTNTWQWSEDPEVIKSYNIPRQMLFDLKMPGSILGYVTEWASKETGVPMGIPVVATANDKAVEGLGSGLIYDNTALLALGTFTSSMVNGKGFRPRTANYWTNMASVPKKFLYESIGIIRGMWTVSWIRDLFGEEVAVKAKKFGISVEEYLEKLARLAPAGSDGLMTVLDWAPPPGHAYRKGIMIGFDDRHTRGHMYRSVLEALAYTTKNKTEAMCDELGMKLGKITVAGGGSNSDLFMQIIADVYGIPASRTVVNDAVSLGSAICAAVAIGAYKDFETAVDHMVHIKDSFVPDKKNSDFYNKVNNDVYKNISKYTDEILKKAALYF